MNYEILKIIALVDNLNMLTVVGNQWLASQDLPQKSWDEFIIGSNEDELSDEQKVVLSAMCKRWEDLA